MSQQNSNSEEDMSSITSKEWLNLSWNYFQQHAEQRISYFNFFVVFSTILTAGLISTYANDFKAPYLGVGIGLIESFVSFIFLKIDSRNMVLTRNAEKVIKKIESDFDALGKESYKLFTSEEATTAQLKNDNKNKFILYRHITHGQSYKIIYCTFFFIGILMAIASVLISFKATPKVPDTPKVNNYYNFPIKENKPDTIRNCTKTK
jgi:hypothetical protein